MMSALPSHIRRPPGSMLRSAVLAAGALHAPLLLALPAPPQSAPPGFEEAFALAPDRAAALAQLVPGSPEWSYYRCLHLQQTGAFAEAQATLDQWIASHGRDARVEELENRQALLTFESRPDATFQFLRDRLGLRFDHRRTAAGVVPDLPTQLDPVLIAPGRLLAKALADSPGSLGGVTDDGLARLDASALSPELRTKLLERLTRPDVPGLAALVVSDLQRRNAGFGSLRIHGLLLLAQLQECARLEPRLLDSADFVNTWLLRLVPGADSDWQRDDAERLAYLERLEAFVLPLPPVHNSLKAHVLFQRLLYERDHGRTDKERLLAYLRLPRRSWLRNSDWTDRHSGNEQVDAGRAYPTGLPPIDDDETFVRASLIELFRAGGSYAEFAPLLNEDALRPLFAEAMLLYGAEPTAQQAQEWYAMLGGPAAVEALRSRVEIAFAPTNQRFFSADEPVVLDVDLKHVDRLLVRVFEIDAFNVYTGTEREIDASLALDGLVANTETLHEYAENPLRRVRRRFQFPELAGPGVAVVEFVADGLASRAVIHKGRLQFTQRVGAAGHVFRVLDDAGRPLPESSLWMDDHLYVADAQGEIAVPFSTDPGPQTIVLRGPGGERATLATFQHLAERYSLQAGVFVDREALLPRHVARVLVRPVLRVNDRDASLALLKAPTLTITAVDVDGVATAQQVRDVALSAGGEFVHEIQVPERLTSLTVSLTGRVASLSRGKDEDLAAEPVSFTVNAIDRTTEVAGALLGRTPEGYVLDVLGRTGEPLADATVALELQHRDFRSGVPVALRADARGRVELGQLPGIERVNVNGFSSSLETYELSSADRTWPSMVTGLAGTTLRLPAPADPASPDGAVLRDGAPGRASVSLLSVCEGGYVADYLEHVTVRDGLLELRDLPPGSYDLLLRQPRRNITVEITAGVQQGAWLLGRSRLLPATGADLLAVTDVSADDAELVVRLANARADTRVHVITTRYLPAFDPFLALELAPPWLAGPRTLVHAESGYASSRAISDEQRYVLDRRSARKYPGNMLRRPTLLLNPQVLEETETDSEQLGIGGASTGGRARGSAQGGGAGGGRVDGFTGNPGQYVDLRFLPAPAITLANLRPAADGVLRVPRADLGPGQLVHVLAVDGTSTVQATLALPQAPLLPRDLTLARAFDAGRHLGERRRIEFLDTGATAVIEDVTTSRAEVLDSLASVFRVFGALSGSTDLPTFEFLLHWPEHSRERKLELLSEHGCHELHLFLYEHDRPFFDEIVRPHLRHKLRKTFLDRWLLDDDLTQYTAPWEFAQLNVMERVLLARRLPALLPAATRGLAESLELLPKDPAAERRRLQALLQGAALDTAGGFADAVFDAGEAARMPASAPAPAVPPGRAGGITGAQEQRDEKKDLDDAESEVAAEEALDMEGLSALGYLQADRDEALRAGQRALYRAPDRTREVVEQNYWQRLIAEQNGSLLPVNGFWLDFARAGADAPFVSTHVAEAAGGINEMLLALAVLDLPFTPSDSPRSTEGARLTLTAGSPLLLVREQIEAIAPAADASPVFVGQNLFRLDDRTRRVGGEEREVFVTDEFLVNVVYGSLVVITNPTSAPQSLQALVQVPQGAIAVGGALDTASADVQLGPYATTTLQTCFYWPRPGDFPQYPVQVARDGELLAFAEPAVRHVVLRPSAVDTGSWEHVSQDGTPEQVWAFLEQANLKAVDLTRLAWRLSDPAFFGAAVRWFGERETWVPVVWSYALLHRDAPATREYLKHRNDFIGKCGLLLRSPLLDIDPIERRFYQHVEYEPLIHARAHPVGARRTILNASLAWQYGRLMKVLGYAPLLDDLDWLSVSYYMGLQDRIPEALAAFARVNTEQLPGRLQYDLMAAWLDFFTEQYGEARALAERYRDYPVPRWQARFREVLAQLDEAEGLLPIGGDGEPLLAGEPSLELELDGPRAVLRSDNLAACELRWFPMDAELLFSRDPFGEQDTEAFATIRPARTDRLTLDPEGGTVAFDMPEEFRNRSVLVEARGGGLTRREPRYASALAVQLLETRGQLRVTRAADGEALPTVYVKVFARTENGDVRFHKDGYTDLRGRFDYASVSGESGPDGAGGSGGDVEDFAILVLSESEGTVIRRAAPPAR